MKEIIHLICEGNITWTVQSQQRNNNNNNDGVSVLLLLSSGETLYKLQCPTDCLFLECHIVRNRSHI